MNKMDKTRLCIGIDLGTTNTTVAISRTDLNGVVLVDDQAIYQAGSNRTRDTLPSILYVKDGKEYVGNKALDLKKNYIQSPGKELAYLENTKLFIGAPSKKWIIEGNEYTAIDVAERILKAVKKDPTIRASAENAYVCITVPANFNTDQRDNTEEAAKRAGFENVELREEPKAAILSFLHEEKSKRELQQIDLKNEKKILVIDLGGGTCDICVEGIIQSDDTSYKFRPLATGRNNLGGSDFDKRIAIYLAQKYDLDIPEGSEGDIAFAQLCDIGQTFKESLSGRIEDYIYEEYDAQDTLFIESNSWKTDLQEVGNVSLTREILGQRISFSLSASEFLEAVQQLIYSDASNTIKNKNDQDYYKNMEELVKKTLEENDVELSDVDIIFFTGGMANCIVLKAALYEIFGKRVISPDKPLLAVSRGASLMNKYEIEDAGIADKMSRSIMIETQSGHFKKLIAAGETVPVEDKVVEETFRTTSRNGVVIRLFEGKDEYDNQLRKSNNVYTIQFDSVCELNREFQIKYSISRTKQPKFTIRFLDDNSSYTLKTSIQTSKEG